MGCVGGGGGADGPAAADRNWILVRRKRKTMSAVISSDKVVGKVTFEGGVHPPDRKKYSASAAVKTVVVPAGGVVVVPMVQHIGAPCKPCVDKKQEVTAGQEVGNSDALVSAVVHSPVNGVIKDVSEQPHPRGDKVMSVVIEVGPDQPVDQPWLEIPSDFDIGGYDRDAVVNAARKAGVVGQGGAAFPTAVKLMWNPSRPVDTVIVNGCECEPYLTSDHRLMVEAPGPIVAGLRLAMKAIGAKRGIIAIEDNKPDAINRVASEMAGIGGTRVVVCKTKYPQGGERQLIKAVSGRVVATGGLPREAHVVVVNVGTVASLAWACVEGRPVTHRIVTVTGKGVKTPGNFRVPVGMLVADLIEVAGGLRADAAKVLLGGPMMGPATPRLDVPVLKGTSGITVLREKDISRLESTACIRCSRCVDYCPLRLVPTRIAHAVKARDIEMAGEYDALACVECGCCSFVCPSQIPLVQHIRLGKALLREAADKE